GPAALPAGRVRALVPDQAPAHAGAVPAPRRRPAGEIRAVGRADGAPGRLAAADERQRPAGGQPAVAVRRGAEAGADRPGRGPGRTRRKLAPALAAQPALRSPPGGRRNASAARPAPRDVGAGSTSTVTASGTWSPEPAFRRGTRRSASATAVMS